MKSLGRSPCIVLLTSSLLALLTCAAGAGEDAGVRSVFARGAGGRALALGGAYVAVANDASGLVWNPGGLNRVGRTSLYATHSNLIGMGFSEQMAAVILPNWRLGTFGFCLRRFGVDGIEGTDERGLITATSLEDSETELALGYGRSLGSAWHLGGTLKFQRQALAGYSDAAGALDIGVQVQPLLAAGSESPGARELTLGLALRNLVEPKLQLDQESVPDPLSIRMGAALDHHLSSKLGILLTTDLEKTRDMETRLHAGCEIRLLNLLALRAGTNAGMFVAGMGVEYQDVTLDVTFEDNPLETVTRIGLGMNFGASTQEQRQAALAAEERQLQDRLEAAFAQERSQRIQQTLATARQSLSRADPEECLLLTATLRVLDPDNIHVSGLEAAAYRNLGQRQETAGDLAGAALSFGRCLALAPEDGQAKAGLDRVRQTSDQQAARTAELRNLFDQAMAAYAQGDLVAARDLFQEVLTLQPDDEEARYLLNNTEQTLQLRAGSLAERANSLALLGQLDEAGLVLAEARQLAPDHPAVVRAGSLILARGDRAPQAQEQTRSAEQQVAAAAPSARSTFNTLPADRRREVATLYRNGLDAASMGRRDDALGYWELVWSMAPDYQQVAQHLKEEYLVRGMEFFATGDLEKAIDTWEKARMVDPNDLRAQGYLARAHEQKSRIQEIRRGR